MKSRHFISIQFLKLSNELHFVVAQASKYNLAVIVNYLWQVFVLFCARL